MPARKRSTPAFGYSFEAAPTPVAAPSETGQPTAGQRGSEPAAPRRAFDAVGLVDDDGAAAFFNCSKRTFTEFMDAAWMPRPIRLGPRLRRWSVDELRAAVAAMPRETSRPVQPSALRAKINALKGTTEAAHAQ